MGDTVLRVRNADATDAAAIARVEVDTWRAAYAHVYPPETLAALSYEEQTAAWARMFATLPVKGWFTCVIEDRMGHVLGYASGRPYPRAGQFAGELTRIYVLPGDQRRGAGHRLFLAVAERLAQQGCHSLIVWVLRDNAAARGFYERLGGWLASEQEGESRGVAVVRVAYGWMDTRPLISTLARV